MHWLFALPILLLNDGSQFVVDTELYQVMDPREVLIAPDGGAYVLNFDAGHIRHYDANGQLKRLIGGKGKGPGQFTFPTYFTQAGGRLLVFDMLSQTVSEFNLNGDFIRQLRPSSQNLRMVRSEGGWFYWDASFGKSGQPTDFYWAEAEFANPRKLAVIADTGWQAGTSMTNQNGRVSISYSPLSITPQVIVSLDGSRCYLADSFKFEIRVFDGTTGDLIMTLNRSDPAIPFDEEWADARFEEETDMTRRRNPGVNVKKLYPEFFPAIRSMQFGPAGNLVVDRWRGRPDDHHYYVAYNAAGQEVPVTYSAEVLRRFVGSHDGHGILITYQSEGDAGLAKVPLSEMETFVQSHPIDDWSRSRSISISN